MWQIYSLAGGLFNAISDIARKKSVEKTDIYVVSWAMVLLGLPIGAIFLLLEPFPSIQGGFLQYILLTLHLRQ